MNLDALAQSLARMFECDTARISEAGGEMFLVIGHRRNTTDDVGQWYRNGEPINFDYIAEECVASGKTQMELTESAKHYKRLCGMTTLEYLHKQIDEALA